MRRIVHAELVRLLRPRSLAVTASGAVLFAVVTAVSVLLTASAAGAPASRRDGASVAALTGAGGGTEAFVVGASFLGFLVFVIAIALVATEFSSGTFRALLLRDPHRMRLVVGKLVGFLIVAAGALVLAELVTFALSWTLAPAQDIPTAGWFGASGIATAVGDFAVVFAGVAGWAVFGTALGVVFRSAPIALAVGFAWAGPFENIVSQSWDTGYRWFPGQVLASMIRGGTIELGFGRALATAVVYTALAGALSLLVVARRDVT